MAKHSQEVRELARQIGIFYYRKNNHDKYKTQDELHRLRITDMEIKDDKLYIYVTYPGLLIGPKGKNIEALIKHLDRNVHIVENMDDILTPMLTFTYEDRAEPA